MRTMTTTVLANPLKQSLNTCIFTVSLLTFLLRLKLMCSIQYAGVNRADVYHLIHVYFQKLKDIFK